MIRSRINTRGDDDDFFDEGESALVLYKQRWLQLVILSCLALVSDMVCFAVAAAPETWDKVYDHGPSNLINIFLSTNVISCLLVTDFTRTWGLKKVVITASVVMAIGCVVRSGFPWMSELPDYRYQILGTVLVGAAQPMFQCTPPLLSATWFGTKERALSTAVAINFNQVGIGVAFLLGGSMAQSVDGLRSYFMLISTTAILLAVVTIIYFEEKPLTPPSASAAIAKDSGDDKQGWFGGRFTFPYTCLALLKRSGFLQTLAAFITSIGITNVVSTFAEPTLHRAGIDSQLIVDLTGAGFQVAIVVGGIFVGGYVDRSKEYKAVTLACLSATLGLLILLGFACGFKLDMPAWLVVGCMFVLGMVAGPIQPVNAELAVEVSYPEDETSIASLQQLCGNLFSALLVPLCEISSEFDFTSLPGFGEASEDMRGDSVVLVLLALLATLYFTSFDAPLKRSEFDSQSISARKRLASPTKI